MDILRKKIHTRWKFLAKRDAGGYSTEWDRGPWDPDLKYHPMIKSISRERYADKRERSGRPSVEALNSRDR